MYTGPWGEGSGGGRTLQSKGGRCVCGGRREGGNGEGEGRERGGKEGEG